MCIRRSGLYIGGNERRYYIEGGGGENISSHLVSFALKEIEVHACMIRWMILEK